MDKNEQEREARDERPLWAKACGGCQQLLPLTAFSRCQSRKDGLQARCKECNKKYYQANKEAIKEYQEENKETIRERKKEYREENREAIREGKKEWYQENKEAVKEYVKEWRLENPEYHKEYYQENTEAIKESNKKYRLENLEAIKEYNKEWAKENPDKVAACGARRRARKLAAGVFEVTSSDLERLYARQQGECAYCSSPLTAEKHLDHVTPLSRGGRHSIGNLVWACPSCNLRKSAKSAYEFKCQLRQGARSNAA